MYIHYFDQTSLIKLSKVSSTAHLHAWGKLLDDLSDWCPTGFHAIFNNGWWWFGATLWWTNSLQLKMAIEIVDFPIHSMVIFHGKMLVHQRVSLWLRKPPSEWGWVLTCGIIMNYLEMSCLDQQWNNCQPESRPFESRAGIFSPLSLGRGTSTGTWRSLGLSIQVPLIAMCV